MKKLTKRIINETYSDKTVTTKVIEFYQYDTEEEKLNHSKEMQLNGFSDGGIMRENIGDLINPNFVWAGSYSSQVINEV